MISRKRTWKDCEDPKILAVYKEVMAEAKRLYPQYFEKQLISFILIHRHLTSEDVAINMTKAHSIPNGASKIIAGI